mmetsp:Transcript_16188/g.43992  ORF Transcript_16188/g.43992 Transcript_16188/m.43992 type:complete len:202 (-) Transcript_16188:387-992(-)
MFASWTESRQLLIVGSRTAWFTGFPRVANISWPRSRCTFCRVVGCVAILSRAVRRCARHPCVALAFESGLSQIVRWIPRSTIVLPPTARGIAKHPCAGHISWTGLVLGTSDCTSWLSKEHTRLSHLGFTTWHGRALGQVSCFTIVDPGVRSCASISHRVHVSELEPRRILRRVFRITIELIPGVGNCASLSYFMPIRDTGP